MPALRARRNSGNADWTDDAEFRGFSLVELTDLSEITHNVAYGELPFVRFIKGPNHGLYLKMRFMLADGMVGVGEQ